MISYILLDIEGTTSSIDFVHKVLFPYSAKHLRRFVKEHTDDPIVRQCLDETIETMADEDGKMINSQEAITQLLQWIEEDRKHPALKRLQGLIWEDGYVSGEYESHIYADVLPALEAWDEKGITIGVYSSGSVTAQKLFFNYTEEGDLRAYITDHFDTEMGAKRDPEAYRNIQEALGVAPGDILFLSDIGAELDAAKTAGFQTIQVMRPGNIPSAGHRQVSSFAEVRV